MQIINNEISKEKYEEYKTMTIGDLNKIIKTTLPDYIVWGYGYYGCYLKEDKGKYYVCINIGSSCD